MYLHCNRQTSVQNLERHARRLHNQIRFYEDRLPENGSRKLETLSIHFEAALAPPKLPSDLLIVPLYLGKHRFIPTIRNISFTGSGALPWVDRLHHKWSVMPSLPDLRCVRLEVPNSSRPEDEYLPALLLARYPKLQALDIPAEGAITAEKDTKWPMQTAAMAKSSLKRLFVQGNMIAFDGRQDDQLHLEGLEHIDIGCASYSSLITKCALPHLRTLCLNNSLLYTCYTGTQPPPPFAESTRDLDTFLNSPLEFPVLETFKIVYTDPSWGYRFRPTDRQEVRPSLYLGRLKAPKLRSLTIKNFGASLSTPSRLHVRERRAWLDFCERHPQLEELVITKTAILELEQSIQCLPNLQKLLLSAVDLPAGVLKSATSPALPALRQLSVSNCSNITSGNLLRLVQSKNGKLEYLNIDGCTELQREAVDWLKNNVKEVKWSGWRDKNERRPFTLRS